MHIASCKEKHAFSLLKHALTTSPKVWRHLCSLVRNLGICLCLAWMQMPVHNIQEQQHMLGCHAQICHVSKSQTLLVIHQVLQEQSQRTLRGLVCLQPRRL